MMSCTDADEQIYVNSCEPAASNTGLVAHAAHPLVLLVAARRVLALTRERKLSLCSKSVSAYFCMWPFTAPSMHTYAKRIIDACEARIETAWNQSASSSVCVFYLSPYVASVSRLLIDSSTRRPAYAELHAITQQWHHALQALSPVYIPHEPGVLTRKFFSEWWTLSAHLVSVFCAVGSFVPGQPFLLGAVTAIVSFSHSVVSHTTLVCFMCALWVSVRCAPCHSHLL